MKKLITLLSLILTLNSYGQTAIDLVVWEKLNEYRVESGVQPLPLDTSVYKAAYLHSKYLHDNGYPSKYPFGSGHYEEVLKKPSDRLRAQGALFISCGENIGCFSVDQFLEDGWVDMEAVANYVVDGWINSSGHHKLMISPYPLSGAIGVYIDSGMVFVVLNVVN